MRRNLGRVGIWGVLITICIGPFEICIQKNLDLGQEVFITRGTFINRGKGLIRRRQNNKTTKNHTGNEQKTETNNNYYSAENQNHSFMSPIRTDPWVFRLVPPDWFQSLLSPKWAQNKVSLRDIRSLLGPHFGMAGASGWLHDFPWFGQVSPSFGASQSGACCSADGTDSRRSGRVWMGCYL